MEIAYMPTFTVVASDISSWAFTELLLTKHENKRENEIINNRAAHDFLECIRTSLTFLLKIFCLDLRDIVFINLKNTLKKFDKMLRYNIDVIIKKFKS